MSFVERCQADGWLKVGKIFDPAFIDRLREEFEQQFDALTNGENSRRGYIVVGDERIMLSVRLKGPFLDSRLYAHPLLLRMLRELLGEDLLIDNFTCVVALPGAGEQHLHRDHAELFPEAPELNAKLRAYAITLVIPLVDLTPETGTTRLFPGTSRELETRREELPYISRGDCFLMDYRIRHQGMPNKSSAKRPMLYIVYTRPWFIDIMNFRNQPRINIDPLDVQKIPIESRPLFRRLAAKGAIDLSEKELLKGFQ